MPTTCPAPSTKFQNSMQNILWQSHNFFSAYPQLRSSENLLLALSLTRMIASNTREGYFLWSPSFRLCLCLMIRLFLGSFNLVFCYLEICPFCFGNLVKFWLSQTVLAVIVLQFSLWH